VVVRHGVQRGVTGCHGGRPPSTSMVRPARCQHPAFPTAAGGWHCPHPPTSGIIQQRPPQLGQSGRGAQWWRRGQRAPPTGRCPRPAHPASRVRGPVYDARYRSAGHRGPSHGMDHEASDVGAGGAGDQPRHRGPGPFWGPGLHQLPQPAWGQGPGCCCCCCCCCCWHRQRHYLPPYWTLA